MSPSRPTSPPLVDRHDALIVVDVQNDFCPGGALPVLEGDAVVPVLNRYMRLFAARQGSIFLTRDWHPPNHISFRSRGGPWPPHCVQNTWGAAFHPMLRPPPGADMITLKGDEPDRDEYSAFEGTELAQRLRRGEVHRVFVGGLATDYCVKQTALDGLRAGFSVYVLRDASRGVDVRAGDSGRTLAELRARGAHLTTLGRLQRPS